MGGIGGPRSSARSSRSSPGACWPPCRSASPGCWSAADCRASGWGWCRWRSRRPETRCRPMGPVGDRAVIGHDGRRHRPGLSGCRADHRGLGSRGGVLVRRAGRRTRPGRRFGDPSEYAYPPGPPGRLNRRDAARHRRHRPPAGARRGTGLGLDDLARDRGRRGAGARRVGALRTALEVAADRPATGRQPAVLTGTSTILCGGVGMYLLLSLVARFVQTLHHRIRLRLLGRRRRAGSRAVLGGELRRQPGDRDADPASARVVSLAGGFALVAAAITGFLVAHEAMWQILLVTAVAGSASAASSRPTPP